MNLLNGTHLSSSPPSVFSPQGPIGELLRSATIFDLSYRHKYRKRRTFLAE
ncbi:hypothetical protein HanRHA438_Chr08g0369851 [Helianthus annuus]|uniref:Uncharacterized protein n=1 Tax=Helianthus annuus TaxID=4232 RepID=A0A251SH99_HELAN|nr:hypothetical protein HanXRQr2_Chr08g0357771 [Helianthus annuus]KAJ0548661.1 hypothetical protein HanIR_Chr08g0386271 [Helianthus annuus]KAJ0899552.1 hypothetical protein HanRHA438_Chr08g0369851 [Helianthus annuus]